MLRLHLPSRIFRAPILCGICTVTAILMISTGAETRAGVGNTCPNEAIRAGLGSAQLPDCRAYELVSPASKNGWAANVTSADGSRVFMVSLGAFGGSTQNHVFNLYEAERSTDGWLTAPINESPGFVNSEVGGGNLRDESSDLGRGLYVLSPSANPKANNLYIRSLPDGGPTEVGPMLSSAASAPTAPNVGARTVLTAPSASRGLESILFEIEGPTPEFGSFNYLWPGDHTIEDTGYNMGNIGRGFFSLYEYRGVGNTVPEMVGVDNTGTLISQCGTSLGYPRNGNFTLGELGDGYNAISEDGSSVFFTASAAIRGPSENACTEAGGGAGPSADELYARIDGARTVAISEPSLSVPGRVCSEICSEDENQENGHKRSGAIFQGASGDGTKVFFLTSQPLVNGDGDSALDLYEAEIGREAGHEEVTGIAQVSHDPNIGESAEVQGVARVSMDGSHVYFVAHGVLTGITNPTGEAAKAGADNFYVYDTNTRRTAFIGDLCSGPEISGVVADSQCPSSLNTKSADENGVNDLKDWQLGDKREVDANSCDPVGGECEAGRFLVFTSYSDLTPDDTSSVQQIFEYDAKKETLVRVSIGDNGFNDDGNAESRPASIVQQEYTGNQNPAPQLTSVSSDGSRVVFQSEAALTPQALPEYGNVYEYDAGRVSLISDGQDRTVTLLGPSSTSLVGMDASGTDIFFTTADKLVPQDGDTQMDIYDARIDGGFAPPGPSPACEGDGCQGTLASPLTAPSVGSERQPAGEDAAESPSIRASVKAKVEKPHAKRKKAKHRSARVRKKAKAKGGRIAYGRRSAILKERKS